jgi:hypothetical protein
MNKTTIEEFKSNFNSKLNTIPTSNKSNLIDNEIKKIEKYLEPKEYHKRNKMYRFSNLNLHSNHIFNLQINSRYKNDFINAFNKYLLGEKTEITKREQESKEYFEERKVVIYQAYEFAKYYNWLKSLLPSKFEEKHSSLNQQEKMLALSYLGLDLRKYDDTKAGKVLSQIINMNYDNTRKYLPQVYFNAPGNEVRTKESFKNLIKLFDNEQFEEISKEIKKDLKDL